MRLGRVEVSGGFLLLAAWLYYQDGSGIVWQALLACFLHEFGHCATLWYYGKHIKGICITLFGAQIHLEDSLSYWQEFLAAAAGPGVNLLLAYLFCVLPAGRAFAGVNLALALFNLLPIGQMDGARMLRCILAFLFSDEISFVVSRCLSFSFTALLLLLGIFLALQGGNLTLFLMCFWLLKRPLDEKTLKNGRKRMEIGLVRRFRNS